MLVCEVAPDGIRWFGSFEELNKENGAWAMESLATKWIMTTNDMPSASSYTSQAIKMWRRILNV